jgi:hypothetical protein
MPVLELLLEYPHLVANRHNLMCYRFAPILRSTVDLLGGFADEHCLFYEATVDWVPYFESVT